MFVFYLVVLALLAIAWVIHFAWARGVRRDLAEGASAGPEEIGEDAVTAYVADRFPHFPGYALLTLTIFVLGAPVVMGIMAGAAYYAAQTGLVPQPGDVATEMYFDAGDASIIKRASPEVLSYVVQGWAGFYYFFGLLGFWIAVTWGVMRRYHRRYSGPLQASASPMR